MYDYTKIHITFSFNLIVTISRDLYENNRQISDPELFRSFSHDAPNDCSQFTPMADML